MLNPSSEDVLVLPASILAQESSSESLKGILETPKFTSQNSSRNQENQENGLLHQISNLYPKQTNSNEEECKDQQQQQQPQDESSNPPASRNNLLNSDESKLKIDPFIQPELMPAEPILQQIATDIQDPPLLIHEAFSFNKIHYKNTNNNENNVTPQAITTPIETPNFNETERFSVEGATKTRFLEPEIFPRTVRWTDGPGRQEVSFNPQNTQMKSDQNHQNSTNTICNKQSITPFSMTPKVRKFSHPHQAPIAIEIREIMRISQKRAHQESSRVHTLSTTDKSLTHCIGRSSKSQVILSDQINSISSTHASIQYHSDTNAWMLHDSNSTNGSFVISPEIPLTQNMILIIGSFECTVVKLSFNQSKDVAHIELAFNNLIDDDVLAFTLAFDLDNQSNKEHLLGQKAQRGFEKDKQIQGEHCIITCNFQPHSDIEPQVILKNIESVYDQVGVKLLPSNPCQITKNMVVRFGLINKYSFTFKDKQLQCILCSVTNTTIFYLEPCRHRALCLSCAIDKANNVCPVCKADFIDFNCNHDDI